MLGLALLMRIGAWVLLGLTTAATVYLGWHYVIDDLGGLVIGAMAIVLARALTGLDLSASKARTA
jgi:membrane-associated phospholipid phosphatase